MNKYYILNLDGIDKFKAKSRKEANNIIKNIEFSEDATVYFICETEKRTIRKMVDVVIPLYVIFAIFVMF